MTKYSIPPENAGFDDNEQLEIETSDWESKMAKLVGLDEDAADTSEQIEKSTDETVETGSTTAAKKQSSLSSNPFAKLSLVGAGTFTVFLFAGMFMSQLMNIGNQKPKINTTATPTPQTPTKDESQKEALEAEVEVLKTKLALAEQAKEITAAQETLRKVKPNPTSIAAKPVSPPQPVARISPERIPTPIRTVYVPRIVRVERIVKEPQPKPPTPVQQTQPPKPTPKVQPPAPVEQIVQPPIQTPVPPVPAPIPAPPEPQPDPFQEWRRLAKLGSYGMIAANKDTGKFSASTNITPPQTPQITENNPTVSTPPPKRELNFTATPAQSRSPKTVAVGSSTKGVLATAVFGETMKQASTGNNNRDDKSKYVFVVTLKEALKATDGSVVLSPGTELLAEINSLSDNGLMQLNVLKVVSKNNGAISEKSLPSDALMIRAPQGRPLIANQFPNKGGTIAGMDAGLFVLGGIGKAAELFNRTESQIITTSATGTIINNTSPRPNVLARVLEGGLNSVVPQIAQRNQQGISQMMQRTNVWFLPAGTDVEVYVNQTLQL